MPLTRDDFSAMLFTAVISTETTLVRADKVLKWLPTLWSPRFPEPLVMGSMELPPEIPRITWNKTGKPWSASISPTAMQLQWRNYPDATDVKLTPQSFATKAMPLLLSYRKEFKLRVWRLSFHCHRLAKHKDAAKFLASHFCKPEWMSSPFNRPENFEIHSHKQFDLKGSEKVNSWMRIKTVNSQPVADQNKSEVVTEQDFNTIVLYNEDRDLKDKAISNFFNAAASEFDTVLDLYFPKDMP